jgi:hypothetical protein
MHTLVLDMLKTPAATRLALAQLAMASGVVQVSLALV